jgi:hypothetical protein
MVSPNIDLANSRDYREARNCAKIGDYLYGSPFSTRWLVLTFGTDSTLRVGPSFDTATGLGTPVN